MFYLMHRATSRLYRSLADMALDVLDVRFTPKADIALRVSARPGPPALRDDWGQTAQISQGRHRSGRADGKG